MKKKIAILASVLILLLLYALVLPEQPYIRSVMITACIFATLCQFYNICYGIVGISNFGFAGFMAIGAYTSALLATDLHVPVAVSMLAGTCLAGLAGFILMIPCLRMHGFTPGIVTLAFAQIVQVMLSALKFTNGEMGYWGIVPLFGSRRHYLAFAILMVTGTWLFVQYLMKSRVGLAFRIINDDQEAAESIGTPVSAYKLLAMALSCAGAGFAGAFYAHYLMTITPSLAGMSYTCEVLCMTMFGGLGTISGPAIGAIIITALTESLRFLQDYRTLTYGILLILVILFYPKGIMGLIDAVRNRILAKTAKGTEGGAKDAG